MPDLYIQGEGCKTPEHDRMAENNRSWSWVILMAEKGVALVMLDKQDYINKAGNFLEQSDTHSILSADPTNKQKNKLINIPQIIKAEGGLGDNTYKRLCSTGAGHPSSMGY